MVPESAAPARLRATLSRTLSELDQAAFDVFVERAHGASYAQTRAWSESACAERAFLPRYFLLREGEVVRGAALVLRAVTPGPVAMRLPVAKVERGPVCESPEDLAFVLPALRRTLARRGVAWLSVMPYFADGEAARATEALEADGFRSAQKSDGAHVKTLRFSLAAETLFGSPEHATLRRRLRDAEKAGATARRAPPGDVDALVRLHQSTMGRQGRGSKGGAYFAALGRLTRNEDRAAVFLCEHEGDVVAAMLMVRHGSLATFLIGGMADKPTRFTKAAPAFALAAEWAKERGSHAFDLGGVPMDNDDDDKRKSIADFKRLFAKDPVTLVHEHVRLTIP